MALVGFDKHENYSFKQKALNKKEKEQILSNPINIELMANAETKIEEAKEKVKRLQPAH